MMGSATFAAPSMVGDYVDLYHFPQYTGVENYSTTVEVVDPGVEYITDLSLYTLDLSETTIQLTSLSDWYSPYFNTGNDPSKLIIRDIDIPGYSDLSIGSIAVDFSRDITPEDDAPMDWPEFSADNISFSGHEVTISYGGYSFPEDSYVTIDLTFVPEPGTVTLLLAGCLGAAGFWRYRRS
ncbi:PEP-CTERM sorting domain-containing protein [Aeoliella mucimassa]|nr:PEP-CTERM sorting domain-containing protein [Aeoliella mucimassa]